MKKVFCLILSVLMILCVGCSGNEDSKSEETTKTESEKISNEITIYSLKDDTLCPILTDNDANRQMLCIVHEALVRLKDNMEAEGVLATDWSVSSDGLSWTFKLRDNVRWHSGDYLNPGDVVYTVEQIKKNAGGPYESNVQNIAGAEAIGNSVVFTLSRPCANFVNLMTFPIVKKQMTDLDRTAYIPNGTGAYIFSDKNEGNMYYLSRNDTWWGGKAKIAEIKVRILPDSETVMYSLSSGDIDIADTERNRQGKFVSNTDVNTKSYPMMVYDFIGVNHNNLALTQNEVRQAIDMAVNRERVINDIFAGGGSKARSPMRAEWFINGENQEEYTATWEDAERALLKGEWKKNHNVYAKKIDKTNVKLEFELLVNEENINRINIAESIKFDLQNAGIIIDVIPLPYDEYESRIVSGDYELFLGSVMLSADLDYRFLLGEGNMFAYESEALNKAMEDTQIATTKEGIISSYGKFRDRFNEEMPIIGLCFENFDMLLKKRISRELKSSQNNIYDGIFGLELKGQENG